MGRDWAELGVGLPLQDTAQGQGWGLINPATAPTQPQVTILAVTQAGHNSLQGPGWPGMATVPASPRPGCCREKGKMQWEKLCFEE